MIPQHTYDADITVNWNGKLKKFLTNRRTRSFALFTSQEVVFISTATTIHELFTASSFHVVEPPSHGLTAGAMLRQQGTHIWRHNKSWHWMIKCYNDVSKSTQLDHWCFWNCFQENWDHICGEWNITHCGRVIWCHRFRSTLAQIMDCCLTAPSHYLNQCWLIINGFYGIQMRSIFQ